MSDEILKIAIRNKKHVQQELQKKEKNAEKAIKATMNDMKARGPAQVTKAVTKVYGIKAGEVNAAGKAAKGTAKTVGKIRVAGRTIDSLAITYKGRVLTPVHFAMSPKTRPGGNKRYKIKATIKKGQRKSIGPNAFLATTGGNNQIPFQRDGSGRMPIHPIKTVSIPQMISNKNVSADIQEDMNKLLNERLKHNLKRYNVIDK